MPRVLSITNQGLTSRSSLSILGQDVRLILYASMPFQAPAIVLFERVGVGATSVGSFSMAVRLSERPMLEYTSCM